MRWWFHAHSFRRRIFKLFLSLARSRSLSLSHVVSAVAFCAKRLQNVSLGQLGDYLCTHLSFCRNQIMSLLFPLSQCFLVLDFSELIEFDLHRPGFTVQTPVLPAATLTWDGTYARLNLKFNTWRHSRYSIPPIADTNDESVTRLTSTNLNEPYQRNLVDNEI
jgi:hypothetical protein